jgi:hypothetical protein
MEATDQLHKVKRNPTRRHVIRKAAYSAPVVFAIAAAPKVALGASGPGRQGNNGFGNGADENTDAPGNSGKTGGGKKDSVGDKRGRR